MWRFILVGIITSLFFNTSTLQAQASDNSMEGAFIDSAITATLNPSEFIYDTIFNQNASAYENIVRRRSVNSNYLLPLFLLGVILFFTLLKLQYARQLGENITVLLNMNLAQQIYRDREFSAGIFSMLFMLNFILVFSIILYQLPGHFNFSFYSSNVIVNIAICIAVFPFTYFLKSVFYFFAGLIFSFQNEINFFRFNTKVLYQMAGVVLLPVAVVISIANAPLSDWAFTAAIGILILVYIIRIVKGIGIGARFIRFHLFYFLLYLCAFEIAPILIIIKVIRVWALNS